VSTPHSETSASLAPDEPPTPAWLPVLGIGLLVIALIVFLALQGEEPAANQPNAPPAASAR
jgi:hypothetical protein